MRSRPPLLIGVLALAAGGCGFDAAPEAVALSGQVGETVLIQAPPSLAGDDRTFEWRLEHAPDGSERALTSRHIQRAELFLDRAGAYAVDRWVRVGAAETWTHRFYIDAFPTPPVAVITGRGTVAVGETATVDGSDSESPEATALEYLWRLARRPRGSTAELVHSGDVARQLVPDVPGTYQIELQVFDGVLWSERPAMFELDAQ